MDQLHLITIFLAVIDTNGFAAAARKLAISPPAVTRAINELERTLGVRLLARTTRTVRATEDGARYADDCRRILADLAEADAALQGRHGMPHGRLNLTAPVLFGAKFVTPIVTDYLRRYPEIGANCLFLDRVVNLQDEGIDVAVRIGELPDSTLQAIRVGQVRRVICAAPAYLAAHGTPAAPSDLAAHSIIATGGAHATTEWRLCKDGAEQRLVLPARLSTTTNDAALAAALDGFGLTRLLSYQSADHVRDGRLVIVLAAFEPPALPIHVLHREGRLASPKTRAFLDLAIARLRLDPALNHMQ